MGLALFHATLQRIKVPLAIPVKSPLLTVSVVWNAAKPFDTGGLKDGRGIGSTWVGSITILVILPIYESKGVGVSPNFVHLCREIHTRCESSDRGTNYRP